MAATRCTERQFTSRQGPDSAGNGQHPKAEQQQENGEPVADPPRRIGPLEQGLIEFAVHDIVGNHCHQQQSPQHHMDPGRHEHPRQFDDEQQEHGDIQGNLDFSMHGKPP